MQLRYIQLQLIECVEVYYEQLFKLANCVYVKIIDLFHLYCSNMFATRFSFGNSKYEKGRFNKI
jgi:hypothetical protein